MTAEQNDAARSDAAAATATVAASQAAVDQARLNLQYATIRAPISGRTGQPPGARGQPGSLDRLRTPLVTINQIQPILVRFAVPAANLPRDPAVPRQPDRGHRVARPAAASTSEGTLAFVDNAVDTTTGTILLKGSFPNTDGALWPGEFVNVRLRLFVDQNALVVPASAVVSGQQGSFVFVIQPDSSAATRPVKVDRTAGDIAIVSGEVKPGDRVVTDGQLRLRQGVQGANQGPGRQRPGGGVMNFTGLFIRRPVMTTLVMAGILIFGLVAYRQLPVSDLPAVDYPTISVSANLLGREPRDHGVVGGDAAGEAVLDHPRHRRDDVDQRPGEHPDLAAVRPEPQHRRGRAGRAGRHLAGAAPAAAGHAAAELPEGGPVVVADRVLRAHGRTRCRCRSSTSTPRRSWPSGSRPWTAWRRCRCTARRSTRCASSSTRSSSRRGASGSTRWPTAVQNGNVNLPTGILWGTDKAYAVESQGQLTDAAGFAALVVAYRDGAPVRLGDLGHVIDSVQDTKQASWFNGAARHRARHPAAAGHQHGRGGRAGQGRGRAAPAPAPGLGGDGHALRPLGDGQGVGGGREVHALPRALPGGDGDLPLPPERPGDDHPRAWRCRCRWWAPSR